MQNNKEFRGLVIGCGAKKLEGYLNTDINPSVHPDEVLDITFLPGWMGNNIYDEIICDYVLVQICGKEDFRNAMNNLWEILKPTGILKLKVPNAEFPVVFKDPMDCRYFLTSTFDFLNYKHYRHKLFNYGFKPWEILKIKKIGDGTTPNIKDRLYVEMSPYKIDEQN